MSSKLPPPSLIQVPHLFSTVQQGLYRSSSPTPSQIPFLSTLNLRTIISLTPEHPIKGLIAFTQERDISFLHLGVTLWRVNDDWKPIRDEIVKAALEAILDVRNHPVLLIDPLGIHQTGVVVGCLRTMMGWNFASTLVEYRSHSGPSKHRANDEQYIELFDPDLINLPPPTYLPSWFHTLDDDDADNEDDIEDSMTVKREADGTIPGEGNATTDIPGVGNHRDIQPSVTGVG